MLPILPNRAQYSRYFYVLRFPLKDAFEGNIGPRTFLRALEGHPLDLQGFGSSSKAASSDEMKKCLKSLLAVGDGQARGGTYPISHYPEAPMYFLFGLHIIIPKKIGHNQKRTTLELLGGAKGRGAKASQ